MLLILGILSLVHSQNMLGVFCFLLWLFCCIRILQINGEFLYGKSLSLKRKIHDWILLSMVFFPSMG
jgi:hypothetical protein